MISIKEVADKADIIVNGYAFTKDKAGYRVLNLNRPRRAVVLDYSGEMLETTMDDIEVGIVKDYFIKNKNYMEEDNA